MKAEPAEFPSSGVGYPLPQCACVRIGGKKWSRLHRCCHTWYSAVRPCNSKTWGGYGFTMFHTSVWPQFRTQAYLSSTYFFLNVFWCIWISSISITRYYKYSNFKHKLRHCLKLHAYCLAAWTSMDSSCGSLSGGTCWGTITEWHWAHVIRWVELCGAVILSTASPSVVQVACCTKKQTVVYSSLQILKLLVTASALR